MVSEECGLDKWRTEKVDIKGTFFKRLFDISYLQSTALIMSQNHPDDLCKYLKTMSYGSDRGREDSLLFGEFFTIGSRELIQSP